ncbi:MAG TPA: NAD(P)/FAD-dependent oxidoreductase [Candidatus Acidoferrum sp.]|jgi:phytoene dehydrogenase-like protein|nr:NAD(P)/FAD-dependent oxidoreductase [Candidatus Acidoferrum sp.]
MVARYAGARGKVGRLAREGGELIMPLGQRVVLIGGGHNALITAFYLAKGGFKPLVLERREFVGGGAITEEFHPGFHVSTLAHTLGPLRADVARDMQVEKFDCQLFHPDPRVFAPTPDGAALLFYNDHAKTAGGIARLSAKDAAKYTQFADALAEVAGVLGQLLSITPPAIDKPTPEDLWNLFKTGRSIRSLGKHGIFDLMRWGPMAAADFVAEFFETELIRAVIAARGIFGTAFGPWSAGSTAVLLLRAAADPHPVGSAAFPRGGLGAFTHALAESAKQAGAEIRVNAEVQHIRIKDSAVAGIVLAGGEEIAIDAVVSGVDPKRTFFKLLDPTLLDPTFAMRIRNVRASGNVAKVNIALGGLPAFSALADSEIYLKALCGRIHIGPEIDYLERAFDASKYGEFSAAPYLDVTIPTLLDPSLAPEGKHVLSAHVQFAPYKLKNGAWDARRHELGDTVVKTLTDYAPNLPGLIEAIQVITPQDLETIYGFSGGHIFHAELALDQLFTMRPVLDWARYKTPIRGLYLCGSGTHPGNGLTGASGANAAREIIHALR